MTIETILIINSIILGITATALAFCVCIWLKAEKKAAYYCAKEKETFEKLKYLTKRCEDLHSELMVWRTKAAYDVEVKDGE